MDNILKQIQEATENFNNLFEVDGDGLGNPAGDVPPSTNKIKKSRKTKDGKVELVSVEDELFPEEGNAREQFRQKIINTINGMIQGTATLEDLMQVVRAKQVKPVKEGFKGAIELLEEIINELKDSTIENALKKRSDAVENSTMGFYFPSKESVDKFGKLKELANRRATRQGKKLEEIGDTYGYTYKHKPVKEGFEGAIEILETALDAIKKSDLPDEKKRELRGKLAKANQAERDMADKKAWDSYIKGERKFSDTTTVRDPNFTKNANGDRKTRLRSARNNFDDHGWQKIKPEWKQVEDSIKRHEKKSLKEAQELLEEIINEVSVGKLAKAAENNFEKRRKEHDEAKKGLEKARDSYEKQSKEHPEDEQALYNSLDKLSRVTHKAGEKASHANDIVNLNLPKDSKVSANKLFDKADKTYAKRGKEVDKALEKGKGRGDREFDAPMKKFSRAVDLAVADPVVSRRTNGGTNESFEQAMGILEEIINEVSVGKLSRALDNSVEKRQKEAQKAKEKAENAPKGSNTAMLNAQAQKAIRRSQDAQVLKRLRLPKDSKVSANKLFKSAEKVLPHRENDTIKNSNSSTYSRYRRAWDIADTNPVKTHESFEQAIDIIEELMQGLGESKSQAEINSIAAKVLPQREANAKKAHDELNNVTGRISPYNMLNGKLSRKQRETVANALNKAEQAEKKVAHAKNLINNKPKEKEPSGIKFNNVFCSCENPFKEAIDILELFDRPDLVDDVLKVLTKKTMKQHLEAGAKKLLGLNKPKKPAN